MTVPMPSEKPVPVKVEARHIELADEILNAHVDASHSMRSAAQLIANSEAAATAELRAEVERLLWNLAGCDTIAAGYGKPFDYAKDIARPALDSVSRMAAKLIAASAPPPAQEQKP